MKKTAIAAALFIACFAYAQEPTGVPMTVYIDPYTSNIPDQTQDLLTNRLKTAIDNSGMGATDDVTQFYLTAKSALVEKHIIPGSPVKYFNTSEVSFYVVDALAQREFASLTLETKGVGNSEQQAGTNSIREFRATNAKLIKFLKESNARILAYYDSQYENIIRGAEALALNHQYEEAMFRLSCVPEACVGYNAVVDAGVAIYRKYLDDQSFQALSKARSIWNAGQDHQAAAEAGVYLAKVDPESKYYPEALELNAEIKERIHSDIDYYRSIEERDAYWGHEENMNRIDAWREVGVAYGNGQKPMYYRSIY